MEEAKALLAEGNLNGAIEAALKAVKAKPTDLTARIFLFELSCFSGDWSRAEKQLDAIGHQDVNAMVGTLVYRQALEVEKNREKLFSDGLVPEFIVPPPPYVMELIYAINRIREGNIAEARDVLDKVEEDRPAFSGKVNGEAVEDFRDFNDVTACVLEAIVKDKYIWIPLEQLTSVKFSEPKSLRDLFWLPADIEMTNGTKAEILVPALYSSSYRLSNDQVKLGRTTEWRDLGKELYLGEGSKRFWMNGHDRSILELREIEIDTAE